MNEISLVLLGTTVNIDGSTSPPMFDPPQPSFGNFTTASAAPFAWLLPEWIVACVRVLLRMNALNGTKTYWRVSIILATSIFQFFKCVFFPFILCNITF